MGANWANTPGPKPGNSDAVKLQKSIAAGSTMPASPRRVKVTGMKGGSACCTHVPGLSKG